MQQQRINLKPNLSLLIILLLVSSFAVLAQRGVGNAPKGAKPNANNTPVAASNGKKTIVILDFDDASLSEKKIQVGRQAALFLANKFAETDKYSVVERQRILQILDEQNISQNPDRYDARLAAKIGKLFSAGVVVLGTVTEYTIAKKSKGLPGFKTVTLSAKIGLAIRLVSVNTGVVVDSITIDGKAAEKSTSTLWSDESTEENADLRVRLFTAAANDAVNKAIIGLEPSIAQVPSSNSGGGNTAPANRPNTSAPKSNSSRDSGKVAKVSGSSVYISGLSGAAVGDKFKVVREGEVIKDPDTGEVLDVIRDKIGEIEITRVLSKVVIAKITSGSGLKIKDLVMPIE